VITNGGRPAARLVPVARAGLREVGFDRGHFEVPDDFDDPLPPELLEAFEA
jgi:antitoxin (DNA-binding transcriptional repressor) of toxin-antitoxin stability system